MLLKEFLDVLAMIEGREAAGMLKRGEGLSEDHRDRDLKVKGLMLKQVDTSQLKAQLETPTHNMLISLRTRY